MLSPVTRVLLGCCMLAMAGSADAAVIYDNGSPDGRSAHEATQWLVANDFAFAVDTDVAGAGVYVGDYSAGIDTWAAIGNRLEWSFFADNAGAPGTTPLASGTARNLTISDSGIDWDPGATGNAYLAEFGLGTVFAAMAGTTYWFAIHLDDDFDNRENIYWVTTVANGSIQGHQSFQGTANNWLGIGQEHAFFLKSTTAPIPAALPLFLSALLVMGMVARRRWPFHPFWIKNGR